TVQTWPRASTKASVAPSGAQEGPPFTAAPGVETGAAAPPAAGIVPRLAGVVEAIVEPSGDQAGNDTSDGEAGSWAAGAAATVRATSWSGPWGGSGSRLSAYRGT